MKTEIHNTQHQRDQPRGYIIGLSVSDEVYTYRGGKKVVVAKYNNGRKVWDERWSRRSSSREIG